jgi:hypothetical protein
VPLFVSLATACLELAAPGVSDLFVKPSERNQLADLRKAIQTGRYDLGSSDPHAVADLLIVFLEELPVPLVAPNVLPLLAEVSAIPDAPLRSSALRSVLWSAPATTRLVLLHYLLFFHRLASRKLTAKDLVRPSLFFIFIISLLRPVSDVHTGTHCGSRHPGSAAQAERLLAAGSRRSAGSAGARRGGGRARPQLGRCRRGN